MRVAVIAPPYPLEEAPAPPLGVTYVAAAFESAGAEVRIFDYIVSEYSAEKLKAQLDEFRPACRRVHLGDAQFPRRRRDRPHGETASPLADHRHGRSPCLL